MTTNDHRPTIKLSSNQTSAMMALRAGPRGSYPGLKLGTLNSLALKGLVKATYGLGSMAMPHTSIKWSLTKNGKEIIDGIAAEGYP